MVFTAWSLVKIVILHTTWQQVLPSLTRWTVHEEHRTLAGYPKCASPRLCRPCPSSSLELLTQRSVLCNSATVLKDQHSCCSSLLLSPSVPSPAPPPSWISQRHGLHYSWASISVVMCADSEEEKGGSVSVSRSHNSSMCVWVCQIEGAGEDIGDAHWRMLLLPPQPKPLFPPEPFASWTQLQPPVPSKLGSLMTFSALREMPAKEWLMRTSAPVWRVTPLCPYHYCSGRIGRLAFPRQL